MFGSSLKGQKTAEETWRLFYWSLDALVCVWKSNLLLLTLARPQESETHRCQTGNNEITHTHTHTHTHRLQLCYPTRTHLVILKLCVQRRERRLFRNDRTNVLIYTLEEREAWKWDQRLELSRRSGFSTSSLKDNISDNLSRGNWNKTSIKKVTVAASFHPVGKQHNFTSTYIISILSVVKFESLDRSVLEEVLVHRRNKLTLTLRTSS